MKKRLMIWLILIPLIFVVALFVYPHLASKPDNLGLKNGQLSECSETPNCVCSFSLETDGQHYIHPLPYTESLEECMSKLKSVLSKMSGMKTIKEEPNYLYLESTTTVFRYVDDLEIYLDDEQKTIHFRSASRIGQSDFGKNRSRVEAIKAKLSK
jgi:uncharacterized protein (DUF1499 family)